MKLRYAIGGSALDYGKIDHTVKICYKKHEYPPNFGFGRGNTHNNSYGNNIGAEEFEAGLKSQVLGGILSNFNSHIG